MAANYTAIENALHEWATRSTGLAPARVVWEAQGGPRPAHPFASLRLDTASSPGSEQRTRDADAPVPGAEIVLEAIEQAEATVTLQVFTETTTAGGGSAFALATRARNALGLDSYVENLDAAGVAVISRGSVQNLTGVLETKFEGRASLDVRVRFVDGAEDLTTWIETVETETTFTA